MRNKVVLIGAGPGDVDLLTIKGQEYIRQADCIVYDRLASKDILSYAKNDCEFIFVGKENHHHVMRQDDINRLLVEKAKEYKLIVRLKGGDPYVFGRGGEEALHLQEYGIDVEIISGVTSVVSVLASAGIPITHRGIATGFQVVTAHSKRDEVADIDYSQLLDESVTLVFLMGLAHVAEIAEGLIKAGRDINTPAAVISRGTTPLQKTCIGTLQDIGDKTAEAKLESPSIIVVGNVVSLSDRLNIYENKPLYGTSILVPYIEGFKYSFAEGIQSVEENQLKVLLREQGALVNTVQVGKITPARFEIELDDSRDNWLVFTSANGIYSFMYNLKESGKDIRNLGNCKIAVVGSKSAKVLEEFSLVPDLIPKVHNAKGMFQELSELLDDNSSVFYYGAKDIAFQEADEYMEDYDYNRVVAYVNEEVEVKDVPGGQDFLCLTSASSARRTVPYIQDKDIAIISIGPSCSKALDKLSVNYLQADVASYEGIVNKIINN